MKWSSLTSLFFLSAGLSLHAASWIEIPLGFRTVPSPESCLPIYEIQRPTIGLALSGGGARGLAQIGVIKVFERHGLPIDYIAGTSIGAVIGGLTAVGYSALEIEDITKKIDWSEIIRDSPPRQELFLSQKAQRARSLFQIRLKQGRPIFNSAYTSGHHLNALLTELIFNAPHPPTQDFDNLKIPFRAIATDLLTGKKTVFHEGSLVDAIHASMAIPLLFEPVAIGNQWLVDGGLVQNLPVEEVNAFHPDLVIAVDTSSKLRQKKDLNLPWQVADQVTTILHQEILQEQFSEADIRIQPALDDIRNTDFAEVDSLILAGERAAETALPQIESLFSDVAAPFASSAWTLDSLAIEGDNSLNPDSVMTHLAPDSSHRVLARNIAWEGQSLYQTGMYADIHAFVDTAAHALLFRLTPTPMVQEIHIDGNSLFSTEELKVLLETHPGKPINLFQSRADCHRLLQKYHDSGFALAAISGNRIEDDVWKIHIDEGLLSTIRLHGNRRSRPSLIQRDLLIHPGEVFNARSVSQSIQNLYATGYFESIRFQINKTGSVRILDFYFDEKPFSVVRFGMRYDLERQTHGFIEYAEENIAGLGFLGTVTGHYGTWDQKLGMKLESDRLFNSMWTFESGLSFYKNRYRYYEKDHEIGRYHNSGWNGALSLGQQMQKLGTVWIRFGVEKTRIHSEQGMSTPEENIFLTHLALYSIVDTRDIVPFPKTGRYYKLEYESGLPFLGSERAYFRLFSSIRSYSSFFSRWTISPNIQWGTVDLTAPFTKQFFIGGLESFMGLPERGRIGRRFFIISNSLRYQVPWFPNLQQYVTLRYDFGGVWGRYAQIDWKDFKHGIGLIWSAKTPLGPAYLAWGRISDGKSRLYFSLGYAF